MPKSRRLWIALWLALGALLVVRTGVRERGVILDHVEFGNRLLSGTNPYADFAADPDEPLHPLHPPYPPSFGLLTAPFALLAHVDAAAGADGRIDLRTSSLARIGWAVMQLGALTTIGLVLLRMRSRTGLPQGGCAQWLLLGTLLLGSRFVLRDTHGGGGNLVNLALAMLAFQDAREGRQLRGGAWLGFSLATKPALLWLLPFFLATGHWRTVLAAVVTGLAAAGLSLAMLGGDTGPWLRWIEGTWIHSTRTDVFAPAALGFPEFTWMNQSMRCMFGRWLGDVPPAFAGQVQVGWIPGFGLAPAVPAALNTLCTAAGLTAVLLVAWRRRRDEVAVNWCFGAVLACSLLFSPLTWKAHHVALLPLFWLALVEGTALRSRAALLALVVYLPTAVLGEEITGKALKNTLQSWYLLTLWDIALVVLALALAWRHNLSPAGSKPHRP